MHPKTVSLVLSIVAMIAGALGMALSFLHLASRSMADIVAGASGFVAGSVLIGAGLISSAILSGRGPATTTDEPDPSRHAADKFRRANPDD